MDNGQLAEQIKGSSQGARSQEQDFQQQFEPEPSLKRSGSGTTLHKRKRYKRSDNDPQLRSSYQVRGGLQSSDFSKANDRLEEFIRYFVEEFEAKLHIYHLILEGETKKAGKFSDTFSEKVGQVSLGAAGGGIGFLLGSPAAGAKLGAEAGRAIGGKLGSKIGSEHHKKKATNLMDLVNSSQKDKTAFRHLLIEAAFDVFQSFEMQFMRVTTDQGPKRAMQLSAKDATNRAINCLKEKKDISISEGVILGKSKKGAVHSISPGFEILYEYQLGKKVWNTASLYDKAGVVIIDKTSPSYYRKRGEESGTTKYGYRRLLVKESWIKIKDKYDSDNIAESKSAQFTDYQYFVSPRDLEKQSRSILDNLNSKDNDLGEDRITKLLAEVKKDILDDIDVLKKLSRGYIEDRKVLANIEASVKNLEVEKYFKKIEQFYKDAKDDHQQIEKSIEANQKESREIFNKLNQKQDTHHEDNMHGHQETQKGIERVKVKIEVNTNMLQEIHEAVVAQKNKQMKESIWFDVKEPTSLFTGREQELDELHSKLLRNPEKPTVISQMTSISGLGGIGKTQLARRYIEKKIKDFYDNVVWINSESEVTLVQSFIRLAKDKLNIETKDANGREKDIKSVIEEVYAFFSDRKSLFIFDNADKGAYLEKFLPLHSLPQHCKKPYILITSRNREWEKGIQVIDLNELTLEDAVEFVKKGLSITNKFQDQKIQNLVDKLQRFPLAIQQTIAYIEDQQVTGEFTIDDYLQEYEKKTKDLLNSKVFMGIDNDYAKTTFTTWKITIDKILSDEDHGGLALEILNTIVYLAPDNINREIFLSLAGNDENMLKSAVRLLVKYSMVNGEEKQSVLSIHRLVQEVTRLELKGQGKEEENLKVVLKLMTKVLKKETLDHAVSAWSYVSKYSELVKEFSQLPGSIISELDSSVRYEEGYLFGKGALELLGSVVGPDHPDYLTVRNNMAQVLDKQGKYEEALETFQEVFDRRKEILGSEHPDTLTTQHNVALVLDHLGKYDDALFTFEKVLHTKVKVFGSDHSSTLDTKHNIALVLNHQGKYSEASKVFQETFDIKKKLDVLGPIHPDTLDTLSGFAEVLSKQGKYDEALKAYQEVLQGLEKTLEPNHPDILTTKNNMAVVLDNQGKYAEALKTYQEVFDVDNVISGPEHPNTLTTKQNIALVLNNQGKYSEAVKAYREVFDIEKRPDILGPDHPETLMTESNMALALNGHGKYSEALRINQDVLNRRENTLGLDHPETWTSRHNMALVLYNLGKYDEALKVFKEVLDKRRVILDSDHPHVLTTQNNIARVLSKQGKYDMAATAFQEVFNKRRTVLGPDHPNTLIAKSNAAGVLLKQGKYSEALKIFQEVFDILKRPDVLGPDHPDTLDIKNGMARVFFKQNNYNKALRVFQEVLDKKNIVLGADHPDTLATRSDIAEVLDKQGRHGDALRIFQEVYNKRKELLGPDHPDTLVSQSSIGTLKKKQNKDEKAFSSSVQLKECLPGPSSGRRKREAENGCLLTWKDVDEINEEKDEIRDLSNIKIDSKKFIRYLENLPQEKRIQLIQLADEVTVAGNSQGLVNKLINNQKVMNHLDKVGRVSGMTMHGMMAKNVLADFLDKDYQGVAINVGFIAGGQGFAKVAEAASRKGLKLASEGKFFLSRSLRVASPFFARGTSAFVIYDLVNQVKAFKNGTEEALAGLVGDSIYLAVDAAEIGIEIAEAFEVLEGVSSVTGPIGATIGALVFVGPDVYMAVKTVDKIDQLIHLTGKEKFVEGLRAFIGMQPERHIQELLQEKEVSNELIRQGLEYLKRHSNIQSYVFSTGKSVVVSCRKVPYKIRNCASGGFGGGCFRSREMTRYGEECTNKFETDLVSTVLLDQKRTDVRWSRTRPDDPSHGKLFCLPRGNDVLAPSDRSYFCENAIGLSSNNTGNYSLINLGDGRDYAKGFLNSSNIFVVNNGFKEYYGGNKDDIFILQTDYVKGFLSGQGGANTLDSSLFAPQEEPLNIQLHIGEISDYFRDNLLKICEINKVIGRENKAETITVSCDGCNNKVTLIDGQGGSKEIRDRINIVDDNCSYRMQIIVRSNTVVYNRAIEGSFDYVVPLNNSGSAEFSFIYGPEKFNVNNTFWFAYEPVDIQNIDVKYKNVFERIQHEVKFSFVKSEKEFNITISYPENSSYRLGNNCEIRIGNNGNMYMLQSSNESAEEIIKTYLPLANRLNKMSFFVQSPLNNETVVIGSGNYEVIHNNPVHLSHLVGNGGENVYVIDSEADNIPEVIIHDIDSENSIDTIDLRKVVKRNSCELKVIQSENDLLLKATVEKQEGELFMKDEYFTVRLKNGVERYNKTHVVTENVPLTIKNADSNEWSLKPQPLVFEKDKEFIVVTAEDVDKGTELIILGKRGSYTFVRNNRSDLMITNAFDSNITENDLCTITLCKYYLTPKMETLSLKFSDQEIVLKDRHEEISTARNVNIVKREYENQVYKDVFNRHEQEDSLIRHRRHKKLPEFTKSGSARPSSWINNLFGWVKSSIAGFIDSKPSTTTPTSTSHVSAPMDVNGTIMLLDVLVRRVTGQKYIFPAIQHVSLLEAQGCASNITEAFEKVVEQSAKNSKIVIRQLNIDFVEVQKEVLGKIMAGKLSDISGVFKSYGERACVSREGRKLSPKKLNQFLGEFNKGLDATFKQSVQQMLHYKGNIANDLQEEKVGWGLQSYRSNTSVEGHLIHNRRIKNQNKVGLSIFSL